MFGKSWDVADAKGLEVMKAAGVQILPATPALVAGVKQRAAVLEQEWVKAANAKGVDGAKVLVEFREEVKRVAAGK